MKKIKNILAIVLGVTILLTFIPMLASAENVKKDFVAADWHFDESSVKSGTIEKSNLIFTDKSGNGNDLILKGSNAKKFLEFTDEAMYSGTSGSLVFNNEKQRILGNGVEFITSKDAPINKENFENGYTIELVYQLPADFSAEDSWMGLLARKGKSKTMTETKKCSMSLAVSNCKELQFLTANKDDSHEMDSAWSVTMEKGGVWYHIAIVSDGNTIATYVNGCEAFRDYVSDEMKGMFADPKDGRFVISGYNNGFFNHYGRGTFQQVRISNKALAKSDWLISDHENYTEKYGENLPFTNLTDTSYNVVFFPDIQNATEFRPNILNTAANWLNENKSLVNTAALIGLGDNVNTYNDSKQWENALEFYGILQKENYPMLIQPGNHDYGDNYYLDALGPDSDFGKWQKDKGVVFSPSGYSSYTFFDGGSYRYMAISLSMYHIDDETEREWFDEALTKYKDFPTIVTSHSFQDCNAAKPDEVVLSERGKSVWEIVKKHNQVFIMISGHHHGAGEEVLLNDSGNEVFSILADYQFTNNGGNAYFKFAEFDEAQNIIRLSTFSPYAATLKNGERSFFDVNYLTGAGNYTVFKMNFSSRFAGMKQSNNAAEYKERLKAIDPGNARTSLFDNPKTLSAEDGHTVTENSGLSSWQISAISAAAIVACAAVVVTVIAVKKRHKTK